mgnify:CR=1 FL=1
MICLQRVSTNCKQIFDAFMDTFARKAFGGGGGRISLFSIIEYIFGAQLLKQYVIYVK